MQSLLEAGYTTIPPAGGPGDGNLTLRDHIEAGMINGPRVVPSERVNLRGTAEEARAAVCAMAAKRIKHTGEIALTPEPGPTPVYRLGTPPQQGWTSHELRRRWPRRARSFWA